MQTQPTVPTDRGGDAAPAANSVSGDPRLDAIHAKKASGETLTHQERGYLAFKNSQANGTFKPGSGAPGKSGRPVKPADTTAPDRNKILSLPGTVQASVVSPQRPPPDPGLVKTTVETILATVEKIEANWTRDEAIDSGARPADADRLMQSVRCEPGNRKMIVDSSPDALAALGIDITKFPVYMFLGGLAVWQLSFLNGIRQLRRMRGQTPPPKPLNNPPNPPEPGQSARPVEAKGMPIPKAPEMPKYEFGKTEPVTGEL